MPVATRKTAATTTRTLLVKTRGETLKIDVPAEWKITFGPLSQRGYEDGNALRLYEAETKQRAVFTNVLWFRDLSIPVKRLIHSKAGESSWTDDGEGNTSEKRSVKTTVVEVDE